jgi:hypothetical protein
MHIKLIPTLGLMLPLFTAVAQANVEKTIFLAPAPATIPSEEPDLDDLGLERLSPQRPIVRTRLNASFPTTEAPDGTDSWFFLENLNPGQRYEVRVCWLATVRPPTNSSPIPSPFYLYFFIRCVISVARRNITNKPLATNNIHSQHVHALQNNRRQKPPVFPEHVHISPTRNTRPKTPSKFYPAPGQSTQ